MSEYNIHASNDGKKSRGYEKLIILMETSSRYTNYKLRLSSRLMIFL